MSTVSAPLRYLWTAQFADGHVIEQPADDRYSKHDDTAEHNPSTFRDLVDYEEKSDLVEFTLISNTDTISVNLINGIFEHNGLEFQVHPKDLDPSNKKLKLIFFREVVARKVNNVFQDPFVNRYFLGFSYTDPPKTSKPGDNGEEVKFIIGIGG